jgi:hypothetical protein
LEEEAPKFYKLFQSIKRERMRPSSFYEIDITLMINPSKNSTKKETKEIFHVKILNYQQIKPCNIFKG